MIEFPPGTDLKPPSTQVRLPVHKWLMQLSDHQGYRVIHEFTRNGDVCLVAITKESARRVLVVNTERMVVLSSEVLDFLTSN